ncbi:putative 1,3-beta-glucan biosynthesis protein [Hortaea werneckii]|nr:putative 1,3-beta-glucan biosynthesis protein [Hortaea werneckii]KAI7057084.1 putative 1,3-beta-glucan biosynthesis protein [Hortaea werneckii]KAI7206465.1 putative 1,3-beta-glucan biosynthesis protein [Hortaea werneckii]KAI7300331.1 putative 1,3-beta-glucan biosynthesis protein [Hortaea werneckii]
MAPTIAGQFRAFWHTLTSNDRHASSESPYRTGNHVPLPQNRHTPLASAATSAFDSRTDLNSDIEAGQGFVNSNGGAASPNTPYSPGMRKQLQRQSSGMDARMESVGAGEIQMQNFSEGLPPPPPVSHSWERMERWLEDNYEELFENLCEGATVNDVNELEHELDCTLPQELRESIQCHDGQERGGLPTGVLFGCMLMDCEEILQEWQQWRTVNEAYLSTNPNDFVIPQAPLKAFAGSSSSAVPTAQANSADSRWRQELMDKQDSQPTNAVQKSYAHPAWIPVARDWGGNNIAIDLAPGPTGKWGQIILMGRDYDCKYVISRSWSAFLATVADDMESGKAFIDEDTNELKLREFKQQGVEPAYIDILRWRTDQKYGRKKPVRRPLRINSNVAGPSQNGLSPYQSPSSSAAAAADDRGRSPHRPSNGKQPATSSPRAHVSSPLARVAEEPQPQQPAIKPEAIGGSSSEEAVPQAKLVSVETPAVNNASSSSSSSNNKEKDLVSIDTPRQSDEQEAKRESLSKSGLGNSVESKQEEEQEEVVDKSAVENPPQVEKNEEERGVEAAVKGGAEEVEDDGEMKDVKI